MTAQELLKKVNEEGYSVVAIRHLSDDENYRIGDICRNSYNWNYEYDLSSYFTEEPEELNGTCGYSISKICSLDVEEIECAEKILSNGIENASVYSGKTVIIAGYRYEYGNDENEVIVADAEVIGMID